MKHFVNFHYRTFLFKINLFETNKVVLEIFLIECEEKQLTTISNKKEERFCIFKSQLQIPLNNRRFLRTPPFVLPRPKFLKKDRNPYWILK
ncbi:hypothetical protein E4413_06580 [Leptospira interrogans]|nr:hypothetical protein E4412_12050 [Leptospira interrogans]QCO40608.1 hypothetical protein E4413_06580 [Leptospira interrogans]